MSVARERLVRLAKIKAKGVVKYSFDSLFEANQLSMANAIAVQEMANSDGWSLISKMIEDDFEKRSKLIVTLALDPKKNATELLVNSAIIETEKRIYNTVYKTIDKKKELEQERKQLLQTKRSM